MGGELPPLQQRAPSMNPSAHRLPSIAALVTPLPAPSPSLPPLNNHLSDSSSAPAPQPPTDPSLPHSAPLAGPASSNGSTWTPINRLTPSPSLAASPLNSGHMQSPTHQHQHQNSLDHTAAKSQPLLAASQLSPVREREPRRAASPHQLIAARRQDSAVSESPASRASSSLQLAVSSSYVFSSDPRATESSLPTYPPARDIVTYPTTPPSPATSPVPDPMSAQSRATQTPMHLSGHSRWRDSPPAHRFNPTADLAAPREPPLSDPRPNPSLRLATSALSPPASVAEVSTRRKTPPPPNFISTVSSSSTSASQTRSSRTASTSHPATFEATTQSANRSNNLPPNFEPESSQPGQQQASIPVSTGTLPRLRDLSSPRCSFCGNIWTYPPPDISRIQAGPSRTRHDMETAMDAVNTHLKQYEERKERSYQDWKRWHQIELGDSESIFPCMAARTETAEAASLSSKRRSDVPLEDSQISSKLRRLSCHSPSPRGSQLTPPPDAPLKHTQQSSSLTDITYRFDCTSGERNVDEQIAVMLHLPGAREPYREPPPNDASNMWGYPKQPKTTDTLDAEQRTTTEA